MKKPDREDGQDMSKKAIQGRPAGAPEWREEWLPLDRIIRDEDFQVRAKLEPHAVNRYREQAAQGATFPPIKVARMPTGALVLVDGWHRLEAGALTTDHGLEGQQVLAEVADMDEAQARWEAAKANLTHGEPLKPKAYREVFRAFIKAKRYVKPGGALMSYREMAAALGIGKGHTTIRNWLEKDFPRLFRRLGGAESDAPGGLHETPTLAERQRAEALGAIAAASEAVDALEPDGRGELRVAVRALLRRLEEAPPGYVMDPAF